MSTELTPEEAYQMTLETGRKLEEQWRAYKKEEARLLTCFDSEDDSQEERETCGTGRDNRED
jgi:hypothetical protein